MLRFSLAQKWKYLFSFYNVIVWSLMATTVGFIATMEKDCVVHWRFGWISMFLAWINFIMYLRRYTLHAVAWLVIGQPVGAGLAYGL